LTAVPSMTYRRRCAGSCASDRSRPCVFSERPRSSRWNILSLDWQLVFVAWLFI